MGMFPPGYRQQRAPDAPYYDTALVCTNGHVANTSAKEVPERNTKFCAACGQPTVSKCANCGTDIRGRYHSPGVLVLSSKEWVPPAYCHECGAAYPWTQARIDAAAQLLALTSLPDADKAQAVQDLKDISSDTPRTNVAAVRWTQVLSKVGPQVADGLRELLVAIASETAKKMLFPS